MLEVKKKNWFNFPVVIWTDYQSYWSWYQKKTLCEKKREMYSWKVGEGMEVINQYKYADRYNNWPLPHTHTLLCWLISHPKFVPLDLQHVFASPGLFDLLLYDKGKEGEREKEKWYIYIFFLSLSLPLSLLFLPIYLSNQSINHSYIQAKMNRHSFSFTLHSHRYSRFLSTLLSPLFSLSHKFTTHLTSWGVSPHVLRSRSFFCPQ